MAWGEGVMEFVLPRDNGGGGEGVNHIPGEVAVRIGRNYEVHLSLNS